jgi:hypothetical protein
MIVVTRASVVRKFSWYFVVFVDALAYTIRVVAGFNTLRDGNACRFNETACKRTIVISAARTDLLVKILVVCTVEGGISG